MPIRERQAAVGMRRIDAEHAHLARVATAIALENLHRRRLARAVGAQEREHLTLDDTVRSRPSTAFFGPYALRSPRTSIAAAFPAASAAISVMGSTAVMGSTMA